MDVRKTLAITLANCALAGTASTAQAASLYLCKAYNGGTFWSSAHCRQHNALIDRIESVPDDLPFEQQVQLAEQSRAAAARLYEAPAAGHTTTTTTTTTTTVSGQVISSTAGTRADECKALEAQITQYEAMARQPQSGSAQDWIAAQKRKARDRQFQLRC